MHRRTLDLGQPLPRLRIEKEPPPSRGDEGHTSRGPEEEEQPVQQPAAVHPVRQADGRGHAQLEAKVPLENGCEHLLPPLRLQVAQIAEVEVRGGLGADLAQL